MDTSQHMLELAIEAEKRAESNHHILGAWKEFLGGATQVALCTVCRRHTITEILPNGDDENGNQVYKSDIRGSAILLECDDGTKRSEAKLNIVKGQIK